MPQFVLTTLAATDYRNILRESRQKFGQYQRDRYKKSWILQFMKLPRIPVDLEVEDAMNLTWGSEPIILAAKVNAPVTFSFIGS